MVAITRGVSVIGVNAVPVDIETELSQGLPGFSIIGLGDAAVQEARYRIQSALRSSDLQLPHKKVTINLAPADLRKDGAALDLPMALGLAAAAQLVPPSIVEGTVALGELALSGALRPVRGVLPAADLARRLGCPRIVVPAENGAEALAAAGCQDMEVIAAPCLSALLTHLREIGRAHV